MDQGIQAADLGFFSTLASAGSLSAAARELGITTPAVSRRLAQMEARLGVGLVNRTTRRMGLTPEGELYLAHARRILGEIQDLGELLGASKSSPQGLLRGPAGDGRVSAVMGTHTHVQTADERILPNGTGFICDAGMCGPMDSVIGSKIDPVLHRFRTGRPVKFGVAHGPVRVCGAWVEVDTATGRALHIERVCEIWQEP